MSAEPTTDGVFLCENGECPNEADLDADVIGDGDEVSKPMYLCDDCAGQLAGRAGIRVSRRLR